MIVVPVDAVVVAGRTEAGKILCSPRRCRAFTYLVSIGGPAEREPAGFANIARRIRLVFEDSLSQAEGGPSLEDIDRLLRFARTVDLSRGKVLVHCQAGISRSSAAAVIILAAGLGPGREAEAVEHVRRAHPHIRPNLRMLELADVLMGAEGRLVRATAGA
jgi:predicted protein tyrosine phosphatase